MRRSRITPACLFAVLISTACRSSDDALLRGDRYWADSNYVAALAEYRLAARQGSRDAQARVAHAYVMTEQLERARRAYDDLIRAEPTAVDQAVFDYVWLARSNLERGDRYGAARATEAALALRPELALGELAPTLARYYMTIGETQRALQFYQRALESAQVESRGALLYELGSLSERGGDCVEGMRYFRAFTEQSANYDSITEARWRMGSCGLEAGRKAREAGDPVKALELLAVPLELGAPQNLLDQAWFEQGETLMALGRHEEAAAAYERVLELAGRTPLAVRASRRLDEIRAGLVP